MSLVNKILDLQASISSLTLKQLKNLFFSIPHHTSTLNTAQWISARSQSTRAQVILGLALEAISWVAAIMDEIYFVSQGVRIRYYDVSNEAVLIAP